jgi:hypothetical protein
MEIMPWGQQTTPIIALIFGSINVELDICMFAMVCTTGPIFYSLLGWKAEPIYPSAIP